MSGEEAALTYTASLPPNQMMRETVGVLASVHDGGAGGTRTPCLRRAKAALSQMSYSPTMK